MNENTDSQAVQIALRYFEDGFNCAQSVFMAYDYITALSSAEAARIMSGFGGGVGKSGGMCGAFTAVVALIGSGHGREKAEQMDRQANTYSLVQKAMGDFENRFGSINCHNLLGNDILARGVKEKARDEVCPELLEFACDLVERYALG